jgi:ankyrin repeat protein
VRAEDLPVRSTEEARAMYGDSVLVTSSEGAEADGETPVRPAAAQHVVTASPMELNVGSMGLHETRKGNITLTNTGDEPMRISDCRTSCGCTTTNCPKGQTLDPGESVDVEVSLRGGARPERLRKTVTVLVEGQPPLTATVVGETIAHVVVEPGTLHPDRGDGRVVVRSDDGQPFRITGVNPDVIASLGDERSTTHELYISWDAWRELGQARRLIVFTDHPKSPQASANIHVRVDVSQREDLLARQQSQPTQRDVSALIRAGDVQAILDRINDDDSINIETTDGQGMTLLGQAARQGQVLVVTGLIEAGADVNAADRTGRTPLMWAAHAKSPDAVRALIEAGAEIDIRDTTVGNTALGWAAAFGNASCVRELLEAGARTDVVSVTGFTPLIWASAFGDADSIPLLVEAGADLEAVDPSHGQTPLMHAARMGRVESVSRLAKAGADIEARDPTGRTALLLAAGSSTSPVETVRVLLEAGADVTARDARGMTALEHARARRGRGTDDVVAVIEKALGSAGHASD